MTSAVMLRSVVLLFAVLLCVTFTVGEDAPVGEKDADGIEWHETPHWDLSGYLPPYEAQRLGSQIEWTHLPVHPRGAIRLAGKPEPGPSRVQPSYWWDNLRDADSDSSPRVERNIAYGAVLAGHTRLNSTEDHDGLESAVEFAVKSIVKEVAVSEAVTSVVWPGLSADDLKARLRVARFDVEDAFVLPIRVTNDGFTQLSVTLRVIRPTHARFEHRIQHSVTVGQTFFLRLTTSLALDGGEDGDANPPAPVSFQHVLAVYHDQDADWYLNQHTFKPLEGWGQTSTVEVDALGEEAGASSSSSSSSSSVDVSQFTLGVYNVWNTNPPSWLFRRPYPRWRRYMQRLEYLAEILNAESPDIVALQEVRFDSGLGPPGDHSQVQHLSTLFPGYQYVWQPANVYFHPETYPSHDEEGCAVFSRFPIVHSDHVLLSRNTGDAADEHQRVVLHAVVMLPDGLLVDVYTTHLSLSETARDRTVPELWEFMKHSRRGHMQVLAGDMNAEPDQLSIQYLQGLAELEGASTSLTDAWLVLHPEPEPRSKDADVRKHALTFPSDDPVKRIDLVLLGTPDDAPTAAGVASAAAPCTPHVESMYLIGQDPKPGVGSGFKDGKNVGMVHLDSLLFASDHRGLIAKLSMAGVSSCTARGGFDE